MKLSRQRWLTFGLGALLLSSGFASIAPAAAATSLPVGADRQLASLTVLDSNGQALSGASIRVEVIPQTSSWGDRPQPLAGQGTTDRAGHPVIAIAPPAATDRTVRSSEGIVNYELSLVTPQGAIPFRTFTKYYGSDANRAKETQQAFGAGSAVRLSANASRAFHTGAPLSANSRPAISGSGQLPAAVGCVQYWYTWSTSNGLTTVGELHDESWTKATFTYGSNADSNIEVGYQYNGGGVSDGGTINLSYSSSTRTSRSLPYWNASWIVQTVFTYAHQGLYSTCYGYMGTSRVIAQYWNGTGLYWQGSRSWLDNNPNSNSFWLGGYGSWTRSSSSSYTYYGAVSVFGVSLHAQSGFSYYVENSWNNDQGGSGCLVGSNNWPAWSGAVYVSTWC